MKLIGTWQYTTIDTTVRTTLKPDHTVAIAFDGKEQIPAGKWRVEANELVTDIHIDFHSSEFPPTRQMQRETISELTADKFVTAACLIYTRVK
jgi:hypothetical protein